GAARRPPDTRFAGGLPTRGRSAGGDHARVLRWAHLPRGGGGTEDSGGHGEVAPPRRAAESSGPAGATGMERDMNEREHEEFASALGAFVLNAAEPLEMRRLEQHIAGCAECAHEVGLLREAATELALLPPLQDAGELVDRIASALPRRPRRIVIRVAVAVAAVSVAVTGLFGAGLVRERSRHG